jgi:hypothetical protein
VDLLSNGRVRLSVGVGWAEPEFHKETPRTASLYIARDPRRLCHAV